MPDSLVICFDACACKTPWRLPCTASGAKILCWTPWKREVYGLQKETPSLWNFIQFLWSFGGTIQETEYTSIQRSALQKGRIHVFMFQGSQKNLRWHFSYKTKNKTMLMFVRMIFLHSLKFIMVGITIQILSLNNSTPFSYFFEVSLILNRSMQRTLSSLTTSLITFFN